MLRADSCCRSLERAHGVVEDGRLKWWLQSVSGVVIGLGDDVHVVGGAAAGHADVEVFAVQAGAGEQIPTSAVAPLGAVDGAGPPVGRVLSQVRAG